MYEEYIGIPCAFCHEPMKSGDRMAICDTCGQPHHLTCWQRNAGCSTMECTGMIREVVVLPSVNPMLSPAMPAMQPMMPYPNYAPRSEPMMAPAVMNSAEIDSYAKKAPSDPKKKKVLTIVGIAALAVIIAVVAIVLLIPGIKYNKATKLLNDGQYDDARAIFLDLNDYKDSREMAKECLYQEAIFDMREDRYLEAYNTLVDLDDYRQTQTKIDDCIEAWARYALNSDNTQDSIDFNENVMLNTERSQRVYAVVEDYINSHSRYNFFENSITSESTGEEYYPGEAVLNILNTLSTSVGKSSELKVVFERLTSHESGSGFGYDGDWYIQHENVIRELWDFDFIQDYVTTDGIIFDFMNGRWTNYEGSKYITFVRNDDNSHQSTYNLPWGEKPAGTKYINIVDCCFIFTDENSNELAKVYKFTFSTFDTMEVYCYSNGSTYYLSR